MLFSILIANYNNGRFFKDCYDSIIAQTYDNWEVIIVDDQSTDDSIAIISGLIKDDKRFKLFENEQNKGCGFTKRRCAELAAGDICGFLDPDDALMPDALALMMDAHQQNKELALVHSTFYFCDEFLKM
ncbi:MAG: glycosyltransferase family 2 protein, partial [Ferruginibacter sp.]